MQSVWSALSSGSLQHRFHFVVVGCRASMCPGSGLHSSWTTYSQMPPDGGGSSVASCWAALMISFWHNLHSQESSSPAGALDGPPVQTVWRRECLLDKDQSQASTKPDLSEGVCFIHPQIRQHMQHQQGMCPAQLSVLHTQLGGFCSVPTHLSSELMGSEIYCVYFIFLSLIAFFMKTH